MNFGFLEINWHFILPAFEILLKDCQYEPDLSSIGHDIGHSGECCRRYVPF